LGTGKNLKVKRKKNTEMDSEENNKLREEVVGFRSLALKKGEKRMK